MKGVQDERQGTVRAANVSARCGVHLSGFGRIGDQSSASLCYFLPFFAPLQQERGWSWFHRSIGTSLSHIHSLSAGLNPGAEPSIMRRSQAVRLGRRCCHGNERRRRRDYIRHYCWKCERADGRNQVLQCTMVWGINSSSGTRTSSTGTLDFKAERVGGYLAKSFTPLSEGQTEGENASLRHGTRPCRQEKDDSRVTVCVVSRHRLDCADAVWCASGPFLDLRQNWRRKNCMMRRMHAHQRRQRWEKMPFFPLLPKWHRHGKAKRLG